MDRTISWGELITIVLFILGAALLFYLVLAAANLVRMLRNMNKMVEKIRPNIEKTMDQVPEITANANKITGLLKDNMDNITKVMENVGKISDTAKEAADTIQKDVVVKVKGLLDVADGVRRYFVKKKDQEKQKEPKKTSARTGTTVYRYVYQKDQVKPDEVIIETASEVTEVSTPEGYQKKNDRE